MSSAASILPIMGRLLHKQSPNLQTQPTNPKALTNTILTLLGSNSLKKAVSVLFESPFPVSDSLYSHLFQVCSSNHSILEARKVESQLISSYPDPPTFLLNRAIETYGKCGWLSDARELFDEMPRRDGGSWNAMIKAYTDNGYAGKALEVFLEMNKEGVSPNEVTLVNVLGSCGHVKKLGDGGPICVLKQVHGRIMKIGFCGNLILACSLVDVYGKCLDMIGARRVFDGIENANDVIWNVIIRRYLEVGDEKEAVVLFFKMFRTNIRPQSFTFSNALVACSGMCGLKEGLQIHGVAIKINFEECEVISSSLIEMYVKSGKLETARRLFDQSDSSRDLISWTSIVSAYATSGRIREARELFDEMPERNMISWNAMLAGYTRSLQWAAAFEFLSLMCRMTKDFDNVSLGLMLNVCAGLSDVEIGKQVHGVIYRKGFDSNIVVANGILDMYGKCKNLKYARIWFYQMAKIRDEVSWNIMLNGYATHGMAEQSIRIFREMGQEAKPSKYTFGTLLAACANIFALDKGKEIHGFMIKNYDIDMVITGALVDMYSKCHCISYALMVFEEANSRDVIIWNSMILGCCHNGRGRKALKLFRLMEKEGVKPDHVTFQGILLACMIEGCVDLGRRYFYRMSSKYCIIPRLEHYECIIELFCLHGCMNELQKFLERMPFNPTMPMLTRVADACKEHQCPTLEEWATRQLDGLNATTNSQFQNAE